MANSLRLAVGLFFTISVKGFNIFTLKVSGPDCFFQRYLNRHRYGNAVTDDLWKALEEVC